MGTRKHLRNWTVTAKRTGLQDRDITFTYRLGKISRRMLTVDMGAIPEHRYDAQQWFLELLGRIWWNTADTESFTITTHVADEMVRLTERHDRQEAA